MIGQAGQLTFEGSQQQLRGPKRQLCGPCGAAERVPEAAGRASENYGKQMGGSGGCKRLVGAINSQRYPLPCSSHFGT